MRVLDRKWLALDTRAEIDMVPNSVENIATLYGGHGLSALPGGAIDGLHHAATDAYATLLNALCMASTFKPI